MLIRRFEQTDADALLEVHLAAIRETAANDYSAEQIAAWAPADLDTEAWKFRVSQLSPFVAEIDGNAVGYADLQPTGHIDQFFVAPAQLGRGVARALMERIEREALRLKLRELTADVSLTAEHFFARNGFEVVRRQKPVRRGVELENARMRKALKAPSSPTM